MAVSAEGLTKAVGFLAIILLHHGNYPYSRDKIIVLIASMHKCCMRTMKSNWINQVLNICFIVPEGMQYIRKQDGVYEIYCPC